MARRSRSFSSRYGWSVAAIASLFAGAQAANSTSVQTSSSLSVSSTVLIFARDTTSAANVYSGLQGYAIPYEVVTVPSAGITLPTLNSSVTAGNYGAIVVLGEVSYDYGGGAFRSALTDAQWQQLFNYQTAFGVRMVRLDVYPSAAVGCTPLGGTAADGGVSISNSTGFPTAGLKLGASTSTAGIWHYPAQVADNSTTWEIAQFGAGGGFAQSTAAVINQFGLRQQMAFFLPFATDWSQTSNFLEHAWIHWATRGLYTGFRRIYFGTQVDDMFVTTALYKPDGELFRIRAADLQAHKNWLTSINSKMSPGSKYFIEVGHNGNGDIMASYANDTGTKPLCNQSAIIYPWQPTTDLEFQKPLGTGADVWPKLPLNYSWSKACASLDALQQWWVKTENRDAFAHVSHTFTHGYLNNSTYSDTDKEIKFNKDWMTQMGFTSATHFSKGLIPPAITGMHNGDAIKAWMDNGIQYVVGDNTRPVLKNTNNTFWPLMSTVASNGYAGLTIVPRWATNIFYNCASTDCTVAEWVTTSGGSGDWTALIASTLTTSTKNLLALHQDPFMFHQANLRQIDVNSTVVNGVSQQLSLLQIFVETITAEMTRLTNWPMITLKHDDIGVAFTNRMTRDACAPKLTWTSNGSKITGATVSAPTNGNTCSAKIPVTFPGTVKSVQGGTKEQVGGDPLTVWVELKGSPISFELTTPVAV